MEQRSLRREILHNKDKVKAIYNNNFYKRRYDACIYSTIQRAPATTSRCSSEMRAVYDSFKTYNWQPS
eukprot:421244-Amphidinium_carterae.2